MGTRPFESLDPVLKIVISGPQGSGKSSLAKRIRSVLGPCAAEIITSNEDPSLPDGSWTREGRFYPDSDHATREVVQVLDGPKPFEGVAFPQPHSGSPTVVEESAEGLRAVAGPRPPERFAVLLTRDEIEAVQDLLDEAETIYTLSPTEHSVNLKLKNATKDVAAVPATVAKET